MVAKLLFKIVLFWGKGNMSTSLLLEIFHFPTNQFSHIGYYRFLQLLMWVTTTCVKVGSDVLVGFAASSFKVTWLDCSGYCSDWEEKLGWLVGGWDVQGLWLIRTVGRMGELQCVLGMLNWRFVQHMLWKPETYGVYPKCMDRLQERVLHIKTRETFPINIRLEMSVILM